MELADSLDDEQNRHVREGLSEEELALFDLLKRDGLGKNDRERVKQASRDLLAAIHSALGNLTVSGKKSRPSQMWKCSSSTRSTPTCQRRRSPPPTRKRSPLTFTSTSGSRHCGAMRHGRD